MKKKKFSRKIVREIEHTEDNPDSLQLKFTAEDLADTKVGRSVRKSDKAVKRYERSKIQLPEFHRDTIERRLADEKADKTIKPHKLKSKKRMQSALVQRDTLPSSRLKHTVEAPVRGVGVVAQRESRESDNSGVESAQFAGNALEFSADRVSDGYRGLKFQPQRVVFQTEDKAVSNSESKLYEYSRRGSNSLQATRKTASKVRQKRLLKKKYAVLFRKNKAKQTAQKTQHTKRLITRVVVGIKNFVRVVGSKKVLGVLIAVILLFAFASTSVSSCLSMFGGGFNSVIMTSYTAEDEDILGADADYDAMGAALAAQIANIENEHPGYDEYRYYLDVIGHDPYTLASYLTAKYFAYTRAEVQADLVMLFSEQYELTLTPIVEIRTRIEIHTEIIISIDPDTGEEIEEEIEVEVEVEYEYHILEVRLINKGLQMIVFPHLSAEELEMFRVYQETRGNRPDLFEDHPHANRGAYLRYEVPPEALNDERFAAMLHEAEKFLGWPYVWGGSSPATSFDCSGYVSWVINNSGWNVGRLGALGLFNITTPVAPSEAKPGDLVFFNYTYNAPQPHLPTHVGIYVGNNMMIHCGNPISYASIATPYWTKHFYAFGRLP